MDRNRKASALAAAATVAFTIITTSIASASEELSLGAGAASPLYLQAESPHEKPAVEKTAQAQPPSDDPNNGALTLTGGVDFTTAYFFRGYNQEDTGLITQPWATITANLISKDDYTLNGYVSTWNSLHSAKTAAGDTGPGAWYESDFSAGLDAIFGKWTLGTVYTFYMYPNGAFETIQEIGFKVAYDDTDSWNKMGVESFALKPYAGIYFETDDGNGTEDTYAEVGVAPSFALGESGVTLAVPVTLGLSVDDYYLDSAGDNETLGYGSIGLFASVPIPMDKQYGAWTLSAGVQYLLLFADSVEAANDGGTSDEILGKIGVSVAY